MTDSLPTAERVVAAATRLFYADGIGRVSLDAVAEAAGVTKKTLYYHFKSKDDLVAAYLRGRDQPNLDLFIRWFDEADGDVADKVQGVFRRLGQAARHKRWKGCGFLRTAVELAHLPGHPAIKAGIAHKMRFEAWLRTQLEAEGLTGATELARQIRLLLDGAFAVGLLQRDPTYMESAGDAARALVVLAATARRPEPVARS